MTGQVSRLCLNVVIDQFIILMFSCKLGLAAVAISTSALVFLRLHRLNVHLLFPRSLEIYSGSASTVTTVTPPRENNRNLLGPVRWDGHRSNHTGSIKVPGVTKDRNSKYTRVHVIPRVQSDKTTWVEELLPNAELAIYTVDDAMAALHPPKNKGHEAMVYLSYIIDHYHELPDVIVFMHAHQLAWHNNEFLGFDAAVMIRRLNAHRVVMEGYMNLRCHWDPGCPEWLHPYIHGDVLGKQEQGSLATCWNELFPLDLLPNVLAQPCCAQFAVSRDRVLSIPLDRFVFYRDWLLRTPLTDYISGRIWEFAWQYVFTGAPTYCPAEHDCYCDGFGLCFGGEARYNDFFDLRNKVIRYRTELEEVQQKLESVGKGRASGNATLHRTETERKSYLSNQIQALDQEIESQRLEALERGRDPDSRSLESGNELDADELGSVG